MKIRDEILKFFASYIETQLGIVYSEQNFFQLENRLNQIVEQLQKGTVENLYKEAQSGIYGDFKGFLLDLATNNETSFFRDPKVFQAIEDKILPEVIESKVPQIRIWCAATSFGQEPYTLSMVLTRLRQRYPAMPNAELLCTDISSHALKRAETGVYTQLEVQRGLPAIEMVKFFEKGPENTWRVKDELRKPLRFQKLNLLDPFVAMGPFHLVMCRNVLIYQNDERRKAIVQKISRIVHPNGYLILGAAESLLGVSEDFKQVLHNGAVLYQKKP